MYRGYKQKDINIFRKTKKIDGISRLCGAKMEIYISQDELCAAYDESFWVGDSCYCYSATLETPW